MAKYIDTEKLKAEIERLKGQLIRGACAAQIEMETNCKDEAYNEVLAFLDSLQQEQPEVDLEKELEQYARNHPADDAGSYRNLIGIARHFAEWQKEQDDNLLNIAYMDGLQRGKEAEREQLMKNAKDGWIDEECVIVLNDGTRIDLQPDCEKKPAFEFEYAQDVRVIVLPKED